MANRYAPMKDTVTIGPGERIVGYDRVVRTRAPFRYVVVPPMTYVSPPRSVATIQSEIRRAVVPGLRRDDV